MTKTEGKSTSAAVKDILLSNPEGLHEVIRAVMQEVLEAEMEEALGASKGERTPERLGYRSGYYGRTLVTRVGKLELRVPQDRAGRFSTELFERYQRSERALVATQGVSTRKVKAITEELCGHAFSASSISAINKRLDESLAAFARRPLQEPFPYLILDARYEKVREAGVVMSQAVLIAVGIDWDGRRQILAVEMANRESRSAWRDFLVGLKARGLKGVELVVSDDHAGLVAAIGEVIPEAAWQRCYVHFLRNALDHLPRKHGDDCLQELRWLYDRRDLARGRYRLGRKAPDPGRGDGQSREPLGLEGLPRRPQGARPQGRRVGCVRRSRRPGGAIGEVIPEAAWQRCYVHFFRNALDHLPRKHGDDCLQELRWLYDRRDLAEARADLAAWLAKWSARYPRLTGWAEDAIEQTLTFFRLPR
ncbi:transposase, partial [Mesorhizobium sp. L103C131B0]